MRRLMSNVIAIVMAALIQIESGGDARAVGDDGRSIGILQMRKIAVREGNRIVGERRWTYSDRWNPDKSREMCRVTLERHYRRGVTDPIKLACRWRNPNGDRPPMWYVNKCKREITKAKKGGSEPCASSSR